MVSDSEPRARGRRRKQPRIPGDFGEILKRLREDAGLTQQQMGERLGFRPLDAQSQYGKYERGVNVPNDIGKLREMEYALGAAPGTLIDVALGPGAYALPESTRTQLRTLSPKKLKIVDNIAAGLNSLGRDPQDPHLQRAVDAFFKELNSDESGG